MLNLFLTLFIYLFHFFSYLFHCFHSSWTFRWYIIILTPRSKVMAKQSRAKHLDFFWSIRAGQSSTTHSMPSLQVHSCRMGCLTRNIPSMYRRPCKSSRIERHSCLKLATGLQCTYIQSNRAIHGKCDHTSTNALDPIITLQFNVLERK